MNHVVMFSGGVGSWAAAKRVAGRHGTDNLTLLFTDTLIEDEDLYRFLREGGASVGGKLVTIKDGRDPWQVFFDERFLGNSRRDPCSKILKRQLADAYLNLFFDPADTTVYVGIDWSEKHRFFGGRGKQGLQRRRAAQGWRYEAPLCEEPYLDKADMLRMLDAEGIDRPELYEEGFTHNNCGGWCVKAGHASMALLLVKRRQRYLRHESKEQDFRKFINADVGIMTDRRNGERRPLTMREFRERFEAMSPEEQKRVLRSSGAGGCGCMLDDPEEEDIFG